jgi:hypothetical protein
MMLITTDQPQHQSVSGALTAPTIAELSAR